MVPGHYESSARWPTAFAGLYPLGQGELQTVRQPELSTAEVVDVSGTCPMVQDEL